MKLYKDKSNPLEEVPIYKLEDRSSYVYDDGRRVRYNEKKNELEVIQHSALVIGEHMEDLTPKQLNLYWILMNNKNK